MVQEARLRFDALARRFGPVPVLRGVSGGAAAGETLVVTGTNGSGKSTLLRCLAGLLAPDSGSIELALDGSAAVNDARARRAVVGYLSPDLSFYDELTVAENLSFFTRLRRAPLEPSLELARSLKLPLDRRAGVLSSGMRQRLRWIWAEIGTPRLLLYDEPFQNLDAEGQRALSTLLERRLAAGAIAVVAAPERGDLPPGVFAGVGGVRELRLAG
jgi:ABC-type multidrug transport system ATPase subunit